MLKTRNSDICEKTYLSLKAPDVATPVNLTNPFIEYYMLNLMERPVKLTAAVYIQRRLWIRPAVLPPDHKLKILS